MEVTPQQISEFYTTAEIGRQFDNSLASMNYEAMERRALAKYPPAFRSMHTVPRELRNAEVQIIKNRIMRQPKIKHHILP